MDGWMDEYGRCTSSSKRQVTRKERSRSGSSRLTLCTPLQSCSCSCRGSSFSVFLRSARSATAAIALLCAAAALLPPPPPPPPPPPLFLFFLPLFFPLADLLPPPDPAPAPASSAAAFSPRICASSWAWRKPSLATMWADQLRRYCQYQNTTGTSSARKSRWRRLSSRYCRMSASACKVHHSVQYLVAFSGSSACRRKCSSTRDALSCRAPKSTATDRGKKQQARKKRTR
jgi:hypothetical protein